MNKQKKLEKIKKGLNTINTWKDEYLYDMRFSSKLANARIQERIASLFRFYKIANGKKKYKDELILEYLFALVELDIRKAATTINWIGEYNRFSPVFVCWWDGFDDAPKLVKKCIFSIKKAVGNHPFIFINRYNYQDYLMIPECILEHVNTGRMCLANFSDYLRFSLLNKYGGLWIDATVYCSSRIPEDYFKMPIYTCNAKPGTGYISDGKWTSFVFGGLKGHPLFSYMQSAFETYWSKEERSIDYLLVDYLIKLGYENIPCAKHDIDEIPLNNLHRNDLSAAMLARLSADCFEDLIKPDTCFYKLSWREKYEEVDVLGNPSIYALIIKEDTYAFDSLSSNDNL